MMRGRGARGPYCGGSTPRAMYLRMVLRSRPVRSAIADTDRPCLCRSRITINSLSLITPVPRAVALQRIMDQAKNPPRSRHFEQSRQLKLGKIQTTILRSITPAVTAQARGGESLDPCDHARFDLA